MSQIGPVSLIDPVSLIGALPQIGVVMAELAHKTAQRRQRQPDHAARSPVNAFNKGTGAAVYGKSPGKSQRLARGDIVVKFLVGDVGTERHRGRIHGPDGGNRAAATHVNQPVPRVEHAGFAAVLPGATLGDLGHEGLPEGFAVEQKRRVAAEHEPVGQIPRPCRAEARDNVFGLALAEERNLLFGGEGPAEIGFTIAHAGALVNVGGEGNGVDPGGLEHGTAGGRGGGEDQTHTPILPDGGAFQTAPSRGIRRPPRA